MLSSAARVAWLAVGLLTFSVTAHPATETNAPNFVSLTISLVPEDGTLLERTLRQLSDPHHARFGRHLSREEAFDLLKPHPEAVSSVTNWLREADVQDYSIQHDGQFLHVRVPASTAASLLKREKHTGKDVRDHFAIPKDIRQYVRTIHPGRIEEYLDQIQWIKPAISPRRHYDAQRVTATDTSRGATLGGCDEKLTPPCVREKYKITDVPRPKNKKTLLGVIGFNGQTAQFSELESFLKAFDPSNIGANFTEAFINGGTNPQGNNYPSGEANLDIQLAVALGASNVDVRFYSVGGKNYDYIPDLDLPAGPEYYTEPYLEFAAAFASLPDADLPSVLSISYGVNEQMLHKAYAQHVCDLLGQLSARGVTILVASGDSGPGQSCQSNDGSGRSRFLPAFPASCPYVTTVGATSGVATQETAVDFSGGGFSDYFPRPWYQELPVGSYVKKHGSQWKGYFNEKGRGFPDVAALGVHYQIYNHEAVESADGTSASTPVVATIIALINNLRAQQGKPSLGFFNPSLYLFGHSFFTDITTGKTEGCPGTSYAGLPSPVIPGAGWPADKGWDAATGWGTPLFSRLRLLMYL